MGRVIANAVKDVTVRCIKNNECDSAAQNNVTDQGKKCLCGCGRIVTQQRAKYYDSSCRKRAERNRKKEI